MRIALLTPATIVVFAACVAPTPGTLRSGPDPVGTRYINPGTLAALPGFTHAVKVTCDDHEGNGPVLIQQWDGKKWNIVSDWIVPMKDVVRPKLEEAAKIEGGKLGYTMRDCSKEM